MRACLIGLGSIGIGYDRHAPQLYETHFSALVNNDNVTDLYCIDKKGVAPSKRVNSYKKISHVPAHILSQTDLFVIATPTETHYSIIYELITNKIKSDAAFVI